jgi:hypothetical protein
MSVGGTVIETVVLPDKVWINTRERLSYRSTCAIYVKRTARSRTVSEGDCVWWQGSQAFWTPAMNRLPEAESNRRGNRQGKDFEIVLERVGGSGVARPTCQKV